MNVKGSLKAIGRMWLKFAEILGNIQLFILFSLVYWTLVLLVAIPMKLFTDPLALKGRRSAGWISRPPDLHILDSMGRQYRPE